MLFSAVAAIYSFVFLLCLSAVNAGMFLLVDPRCLPLTPPLQRRRSWRDAKLATSNATLIAFRLCPTLQAPSPPRKPSLQISHRPFPYLSRSRNAKPCCRDAASSQLVDTITQGISDAQSAIGQIALALFSGQQAPAPARDQVATGLEAAIEAAGQLTS